MKKECNNLFLLNVLGRLMDRRGKSMNNDEVKFLGKIIHDITDSINEDNDDEYAEKNMNTLLNIIDYLDFEELKVIESHVDINMELFKDGKK